MSISATVVVDSVNVHNGARITTFSLTLPKQLVAQFNTYGMISRDSASSRAVPTLKIITQVERDPYLPDAWRYRQRGMVPAGEMAPPHARAMTLLERQMRRSMLVYVKQMESIGAAKEDINRYLEPWMYTTVVATATEWDNYYTQRIAADAQSSHAALARCMRDAMDASRPVERAGDVLNPDAWHLPYVTEYERSAIGVPELALISARRCAGVSYFREGGTGEPTETEVSKGKDLANQRHWSPTEMAAYAIDTNAVRFYGRIRGWKPLRKYYGGESGSPHFGTQDDAAWVLR